MLRHALESDGHDILEVRDQSEATRALQEQQLSLVLTDLRLPEGDGFGVLLMTPSVPVGLTFGLLTASTTGSVSGTFSVSTAAGASGLRHFAHGSSAAASFCGCLDLLSRSEPLIGCRAVQPRKPASRSAE